MALSSTDRAAVSDAFDALQKAAATAEGVTSGAVWWIKRAWSGLIGADSTATAAVEDARHTIEAVPRFEARLEELLASDTATHADAQRFVRDVAPFADVKVLLETTELLSPATAAVETLKPPPPSKWPWYLWAGVALLALLVLAPYAPVAAALARRRSRRRRG